ncbi:MAG: hypothetical protein NTW03_22280, partial [Verrucomicrobia bacterium]|nr:hypothetical protein [Verrucomicrobiota bacterium]
ATPPYAFTPAEKRDLIKLIAIFGNDTVTLMPVTVGCRPATPSHPWSVNLPAHSAPPKRPKRPFQRRAIHA